jgi:glutathione peroxidase
MTIYDIPLRDIKGHEIDTAAWKGKKILVVNVASECGYTPQYAALEELYQNFSEKLIILGCPCNDFGGQEPGSEETIHSFCQKNYGVTFTLSEKLNILQNPHPLYQWLCRKEKNGVDDFPVSWNFQKFLIDEEGNLVRSLAPSTLPLSEEIMDWLNM